MLPNLLNKIQNDYSSMFVGGGRAVERGFGCSRDHFFGKRTQDHVNRAMTFQGCWPVHQHWKCVNSVRSHIALLLFPMPFARLGHVTRPMSAKERKGSNSKVCVFKTTSRINAL